MLQKLRIALFALFLSGAINAAALPLNNEEEPQLSRTLILNEVCLQVEVWGDVEIVLSPENTDRIILQGTKQDVSSIQTNLKNGKLYVRAEKVNFAKTTRIIVPAAMLRFIRVNGKGLVTSVKPLNNPRLKVELNGEASVLLHSAGSVVVEAAEGYDLL